MNIKDIVKDNIVYFDYYRSGTMYYLVRVNEINYSFPVPLDDVGNASLLRKDKAITYMRWIRKALKDKTFIQQ